MRADRRASKGRRVAATIATAQAAAVTLADAMSDHFRAMPPPGAWTANDVIAEYKRRGLVLTQKGANNMCKGKAESGEWQVTKWGKCCYYWIAAEVQ